MISPSGGPSLSKRSNDIFSDAVNLLLAVCRLAADDGFGSIFVTSLFDLALECVVVVDVEDCVASFCTGGGITFCKACLCCCEIKDGWLKDEPKVCADCSLRKDRWDLGDAGALMNED